MSDKTLDVLVEGGKASAAPPLGPQLGPLGVNITKVVDEINNKTKDLAGMKVPVKITVHKDKTFSLEIGTPPVSALVKKELGLQKGSGEAGIKRAGDLTPEQARKIAKAKFGSDDKPFFSQVEGTARSMGITIGKGAITEEELRRYEEMDKAKEAEEAAKKTAKAEVSEEGEKEAKPAESLEAKPKEAQKAEKTREKK